MENLIGSMYLDMAWRGNFALKHFCRSLAFKSFPITANLNSNADRSEYSKLNKLVKKSSKIDDNNWRLE